MLQLWLLFATGTVTIVILWAVILHSFGYDTRVHTDSHDHFNTSEEIEWLLRVNEDDCPINPHRAVFAALLRHWHVLARLHKIQYAIGCGSLLGQHRDGEIIPWDSDVDVLVDIRRFKALQAFGEERNFQQGNDGKFHFVVQNDFERRDEDSRRRFGCTGKMVDEQVDGCSFVSPMARLIHDFFHLDIFPYVVSRTKKLVRDLDMERNYKMRDFFPFKECIFMKVKTSCPNNVKGVLEAAYDNDLESNHICVNRTWISKENEYML